MFRAFCFAALLVGWMGLPAAAQPVPGDLIINELMYDPPNGSEYIELYNRSGQSIDLATVTYADGNLDFDPVASSETLLAPGEYVVLVDDPDAFATAFPGVAFLDPPDWEALNNGGDRVELRADGQTLDQVAYDDAWGGGDDVSLERIDPFGPSNEAANWGTTTANADGTPGAENSIFEIDTTPPELVRVTPNEAGDALRIVFSEPLDPSTVTPGAVSLTPSSAGLDAVEPAPDDAAAIQVDLSAPLPTGDYTLTVTGVADARGNTLTNATATFFVFQPETPTPGDIVVNEILYDPDTGSEYVELYNRSESTFDVADLSFSDNRNVPMSITDAATPLRPGAYVVLVDDADAFATVFPSVDAIAVAGWPALNNGGDTPTLWLGETVSDAVPYTDAWGGGDDLALERKDPGGPSDASINFGSSTAAAGGTPGAENSIFEIDTTPPELSEVTPNEAADSLRIIFSEPLDPSTVTTGAVSLTPSSAGLDAVEPAPDDAAAIQVDLSAPLPTGDYTLTVTGVADARGNTLTNATATFFVFQPETPTPGDIVVNEILYDPDTGSEYVELYNRSESTFDVADLSFSDNRNVPMSITDAATPLRPGAYVVLVDDADAFATVFPSVDAIAVAGWPALNNGGDTPTLWLGETVSDAVPYTDAWGGGDDLALERKDPGGPSDASINFGSSTAAAGGTPGAENSIFEIDTTPPTLTFAEQTTDTTVVAYSSEPLDPSTIRPDAFALDDTRPETAVLMQATVVQLTFASIDGGRLTAQGLTDLSGNRQPETTIALAVQPTRRDVAVTEIMFDPLADDFDDRPNQPEYVELRNRSDGLLALSRLRITDQPDEDGEADTLRIGRRAALPPNGFAIAYAADAVTDAPATQSLLARAFPDTDFSAETIALLPVDASSLGLTNGGDLIHLQGADGATLDSVAYDPDWHAEAVEETKGTSLERISATGPSNDASNWTSSTSLAGGTPGQPNAIALPPPEGAPEQTLSVEPSPFSPDREGGTRIRYRLGDAPTLVRARIYDARGRKVRTLEDTRLVGPTGELLWNGRNDEGNRVRIGVYVVLFEAVDATGGTVTREKAPVVVGRALNGP